MDIYEDFDRAFANVSAFVLILNGKPVGRVAMKHGGQLTAYVQVWGGPMEKGVARGGNYDRATAAVEAAAAKLEKITGEGEQVRQAVQSVMADPARDGERWTSRLEALGFTVQHVFG